MGTAIVLTVAAVAAAAAGYFLTRGRHQVPAGEFDIEPAQARALLERGGVKVLDVRTPKEHAQSRIAGSELMDFYESDFKERVAALDRSQTYLVHCAVGGRSGKAVRLMKSLGFEEAYNLAGGIERWAAEGHPVLR